MKNSNSIQERDMMDSIRFDEKVDQLTTNNDYSRDRNECRRHTYKPVDILLYGIFVSFLFIIIYLLLLRSSSTKYSTVVDLAFLYVTQK